MTVGKRFANPFGGIPFEKLHRFGDGERGGQRDQNVDVITCATDGERFHLISPGDAAEIWPELFAQLMI